MHSSAPLSSVSKIPFLIAAGLFAAAAAYIVRVTATKLDTLELICIGACTAAAGACAALPFALAYVQRHTRATPVNPAPVPAPSPVVNPDALAAHVASAVDARLAAALPSFTTQLTEALAALDDKRRAEILLAVAENPSVRAIDSDTIPSAAGKPRLGRGLEGLIRGNTPKPASPAAADQAAA